MDMNGAPVRVSSSAEQTAPSDNVPSLTARFFLLTEMLSCEDEKILTYLKKFERPSE